MISSDWFTDLAFRPFARSCHKCSLASSVLRKQRLALPSLRVVYQILRELLIRLISFSKRIWFGGTKVCLDGTGIAIANAAPKMLP